MDAARSAVWKDLVVDQGPGCQAKGERFHNAYGLLSQLLVARQDAVLELGASHDLPHEGGQAVHRRVNRSGP